MFNSPNPAAKAANLIRWALLVLTVTSLSACGGSGSSSSSNNSSGDTTTASTPDNPNFGNPDGSDPDGPGGGDDSSAVDPRFDRDCFWLVQSDANAVNVLYPDEFAVYWVATFIIPVGGSVIMEAEYPYARYASYNLYNPILQPQDALADVEIDPDNGSVNPMRQPTGATPGDGDRTAENRSYTVRVISGVRPDNPADREPNTLYGFQSIGPQKVATNAVAVMYRVYVPDNGRDISGEVGLPRVSFDFDGDGVGEVSGSQACSEATQLVAPSTLADIIAANDPLPLGVGAGSFDPPQWLKFFNLHGSQANRFNATPLGEIIRPTPLNPTDSGGGFASNAHNSYIYSSMSRNFGEVSVFEADFPRTPTTVNGDATMGTGDMRYWSLCTNDANTQRFVDCTYDEATVAASNHLGGNPAGTRRVFVVTGPGDRPNNATQACGVNWLSHGPTSESLVIMRHMLAEDSYDRAIQFVPGPAGHCEAPVMQTGFPYGQFMSKADFEALGCPVDPDQVADLASQFDQNALNSNCKQIDGFAPPTGNSSP